MAYYERMDEAVRYGPVCRRDIRLYREQEQQIYKYVLENGFITTAETVETAIEPYPQLFLRVNKKVMENQAHINMFG